MMTNDCNETFVFGDIKFPSWQSRGKGLSIVGQADSMTWNM